MDEIYAYALKLLRARDYTVAKLREKLEVRFGSAPEEVFEFLTKKKFLNDRRFAEQYVDRKKDRGSALLRLELLAHGVPAALADEILAGTDFPSLKQAVADKISGLRLRTPLQPRDAARLFRALLRLGYDEDAIREEIENLEQ